MSGKAFRKGDRVTCQLPHYFDGEPVHGWPNPQYVDTVTKTGSICGPRYARVKYDSGRTDWECFDRLYRVYGPK